ncbi:hypothetical protein DRI50_05525 [candidate division KSB1 bacterium]|nr:MAG: hypothetical protein DRI50_05525 [candidate division KSB1 bacterium]
MKKSITLIVILTIILPLLALSVSAYFVNRNLDESAKEYRWAEHSHEILYLSEKLKNAYDGLNLSLHTYLANKEKVPIEIYLKHKELLTKHLNELMYLTRDNQLQQKGLAKLTPLLMSQIKIMDQAVRDVSADILLTENFILNQKKIHELINNFEKVELSLLKSRSWGSYAYIQQTKSRLFVTFLISLLILFFANIVIFYLLIKQRKIFNEKEKLYALHNAIINKANEAIITTDQNGRILSFNPAAQAVFGYTEKEALGKSFTTFLSETHQKKCFNTGFEYFILNNTEFKGRKKDGKIVPLLSSSVKITLKEARPIFSIIMHDLSKYKAQENKILRLSHRLKLATDLAGLSVWDWNLKTDTFYFEKFLYDDLPLERKTQNLFQVLKSHFFPQEIKQLHLQILRMFAKKKEFIEAELHFIKGPDNIRYLKSRAYVHYDENRKPASLNGITWDITELKAAAETQLKAKEAAEEANRAKSQFLANMSHEIRTPLNAIIGLNLLLRHTSLDAKQKDYVAKIHFSATSLLNIIDEILDFSRIEAGKLRIENTKFNMDLVLSRLSKTIYLNARDKELELIFDQDPHIPPTLFGDPLRISQVLNNLISNAIKFTEQGQIIVAVDLAKKDSQFVTLRFSVKDTGIGIPEEKLTHLFNPFTQADISISRKYGGTGLGLSICKQLVEMMGGRIWAQSTLGQGSTFFFELNFPYEKSKDKEFYQPPVELRNLRILVVDDVAEIRATLKEQMEIFTPDTTTASTGKEALHELRNALITGNKYYDLVILDWKLGTDDGLEIAKAIHNDEQIPIKPKIIMISAYVDGEYLLKEKTYFNAFLTKPFTLSVLFNTVLEVFGKEVQHEFETYGMLNVYPKGFNQIRGARILVAEDNELNQQVIKELLENEGFFVTIAKDGEEAVNLLLKSEQPYDLVLMDLHMPGMDGFEASKMIYQNKDLKSTPVIALTADLAGNVQQKIKDVGMVDFISKPINPDDLFATITRWIKPSNRVIFSPNIVTNQNEDAFHSIFASIPNLKYIEGLQRLNFNSRLYAELLIKFRHNNLDLAKRLHSLLKKGQIKEFHRQVHTLKSTAGNMGFKTIQQLAAQLEAASTSRNTERIQDLLNKVENEFKILFNYLLPIENELKKILHEEETSLLSKDALLQGLNSSLQLLRDSDAKAKREIQQLIFSLKKQGVGAQADELWRAVQNYEFDEAANIIENLIPVIEKKDK